MKAFFSYIRAGLRKAKARWYVKETVKALRSIAEGTENEARETSEMAELFFRLLAHKLNLKDRRTPPSKEEVKAAIEQLKDVGRIGIFASVSLLPGGGFSLLGLELLARKYGISSFTFIPSSFRRKRKEAAPDSKTDNKTGFTDCS